MKSFFLSQLQCSLCCEEVAAYQNILHILENGIIRSGCTRRGTKSSIYGRWNLIFQPVFGKDGKGLERHRRVGGGRTGSYRLKGTADHVREDQADDGRSIAQLCNAPTLDPVQMAA